MYCVRRFSLAKRHKRLQGLRYSPIRANQGLEEVLVHLPFHRALVLLKPLIMSASATLPHEAVCLHAPLRPIAGSGAIRFISTSNQASTPTRAPPEPRRPRIPSTQAPDPSQNNRHNMAPTRPKKRPSGPTPSPRPNQTTVPTKSGTPTQTPHNRSPIKKAKPGLTMAQKQALIDNLRLESQSFTNSPPRPSPETGKPKTNAA